MYSNYSHSARNSFFKEGHLFPIFLSKELHSSEFCTLIIEKHFSMLLNKQLLYTSIIKISRIIVIISSAVERRMTSSLQGQPVQRLSSHSIITRRTYSIVCLTCIK